MIQQGKSTVGARGRTGEEDGGLGDDHERHSIIQYSDTVSTVQYTLVIQYRIRALWVRGGVPVKRTGVWGIIISARRTSLSPNSFRSSSSMQMRPLSTSVRRNRVLNSDYLPGKTQGSPPTVL